MPLDCGSTTLSASIIAMAASVAEPPLRNISWPAALARGSAEETTPPAASAVEKGSAMRSRKERIRRRMTRGPFSGGLAGQFQLCGIASHCLGNMGKTVAGKQCLEACVDFSGESRSFKNKGAVDLNERAEERRGGKRGVSTCRARWSSSH